MSVTQHPVFTVGHSNHSLEAFLMLLVRHGIDEVVDVRSAPYSRYAPQYNHDNLEEALETVGLGYSFLGGELGGRPADHACYDADGRVRYDLLANTDPFDDGIRQIMRRADDSRLALMCTEKEPLECHRTLLVARGLVERGVDVEHILASGGIERHEDAMDRLMDIFKLPHNGDMFRSRSDVIDEALARQSQKVAYVGEPMPVGVDDWENAF